MSRRVRVGLWAVAALIAAMGALACSSETVAIVEVPADGGRGDAAAFDGNVGAGLDGGDGAAVVDAGDAGVTEAGGGDAAPACPTSYAPPGVNKDAFVGSMGDSFQSSAGVTLSCGSCGWPVAMFWDDPNPNLNNAFKWPVRSDCFDGGADQANHFVMACCASPQCMATTDVPCSQGWHGYACPLLEDGGAADLPPQDAGTCTPVVYGKTMRVTAFCCSP